MGDSLDRKSRREGSRSRRGSVSEDFEDVFSQNQPIVGTADGRQFELVGCLVWMKIVAGSLVLK